MSLVLDYPLSSLSAGVAAYLLVRKALQSSHSTDTVHSLPEPTGAHWFWGHEMIVHESSYGETHTAWINSYGSTYKIKGAMFHPDILVTADPAAIAHMFGKEVYSYVKSPVIRPIIGRLMGKSLVWAEGDVHKRQRQQLARFFTTQATRDMFDMINVCARIGSEHLAAEVTRNGSGSKQVAKINLCNFTSHITLDIIGRFAFDHDFECGQSEASQKIANSWKAQVDLGLQKAGFIGLVVLRAFPFIVHLPVKSIQAQGEVKTILREIAEKIIANDTGDQQKDDFLRTLTRLAEKGELDAPKEELLDHVSTMVLVGQETTSGIVNFALHELAKNPEYQSRLRHEIAQLGREPTYEDLISGMPWLDAIAKETFRHRPLSSHTERVALKDDVLRLHNPVYNERGHKITEVAIKAGQLIHIPSISMSHAKSVWGEDADEFRPERWLDPSRLPPANATSSGWSGLFVFSEGPRQCIGFRLAILSFKTILTSFVRNFEFHDTGAIVKARFSSTLQPFVVGEEEKGTQLPIGVSIIEHI
ncbi:Putative cytochrome P450 CYP13A7 [Caenorhabditis elegans] [Rhizoctonia solani]|uniref:Putative cytochrome P450 CYP13A7 [Caenorhabditis elegans] n=1 Tax=Rhizoctonia solani TaxID=456999 RepID=A0A0K6G4W2_9AGAM|nr:Putative cytochrome P450 CYP13A7 [Caenorhabditis elegans] [Rhizoctonia solani]